MATTRSTPSKRTPSSARAGAARPRPRQTGPGWSPLASVPSKYHTPIFLGLILLSLLVFFGGVIFGGKFFATNDNISWLSFVPYLDQMAARGEHPFWIPYIFSGMPAYAAYLVTGDRWWDISMKILGIGEQAFGFNNYWLMRVVLHYFIYGIGMYLLMRSKKAARSTSLFVSMAAMFSTWVIVYIMIGHNTKISVLMTFPFIFLCLEKLIRRWSLLYAGLLILVVHILMEENHPQTAFYGACAIGIYLLFELIGALMERRKELIAGVVRAGLVMVVAGAFAYGMGLDRYLAIQEYTPYSTRGAKAMVPDPNNPDDETSDGGHGYKYATDWSFSPEETITFLNPSYFGFGKVEYSQGGQSQQVMTYWGQMPFTDAGHYMGIAVLILGVFGAWMNRRNRFVQALIVIGAFGLFLSFGRNMPGFLNLYDFFYYNFPSFNKFRAPSQATVLLEFIFPILAGFGIESAIAMHKSGDNPGSDRSILRAAFIYGGMILVALIGVNLFKEDYMASIASAAQQKGDQNLGQLKDFIFSNMQTDWLLAGFFGLATLLVMYFYVKGTLNATVFKVSLLGILLFDLWRVDYRPMDAVPKEQAFAVFNPTDIDTYLHSRDSTKYRILDVTAPGPNFPSRQFHEHIMGYHAAKMRNYQDLLDVAGNGQVPTSPLAWSLLNTRFIISPQPVGERMQPVFQSREKQAYVFENEDAMPRAWFVNRVEVADGKTVLTKIKENAFKPWDVAYLAKPLGTEIQPAGNSESGAAPVAPPPADSTRRDSTGADSTAMTAPAGNVRFGDWKANVTNFTPNHFNIEVEAPGTNFLVISEIYYPSWHATIDGKPAEIVQTDYLLRGMVIPAGKHTIAMEYVSPGFQTGKYASLGLNLVMLGIIGAGVYMHRRRPEDADPEHDAPLIEEDDV